MNASLSEGYEELRALMRTAFGAERACVVMFDDLHEGRLWTSQPEPRLWIGPDARSAWQRLPINSVPPADDLAISGKASIATVECTMAAPVRDPRGTPVGVVMVAAASRQQFQPAQFPLLESCAALAWREFDLHRMAMRDHLTGALSRRSFEIAAETELDRFHRHGRPSTLVLFDLDHFKRLNDRFGHAIGDRVLARVCAMCLTGRRRNDALGRIGGEEFALLLPETDLQQALIVAERLRQDIAALHVLPRREAIVTASFGVAPLNSRYRSLEDWMTACDAALYDAKNRGRNHVRTAIAGRDEADCSPPIDRWNHGGTSAMPAMAPPRNRLPALQRQPDFIIDTFALPACKQFNP